MSFVTYENSRNPHVTIHSASCNQIGKNGGKHKYSQGAYQQHSTYSAASHYADGTGLPIRICSFCRPTSVVEGAASNVVLKRGSDLRDSNYILHPSPGLNYWANISSGRLQELLARCGESFNIVVVGSPNVEGDFYAIPFAVVKQALNNEFRSADKTGRVRWVATIRNHQMKVGRYPVPIDVGAFFGCHSVLTSPGVLEPGSAADLNDYAIENRKLEIEQRQKQSVFRRRVLQNFGRRCCLSGISEEELLVASHIVPWAKRIDTRLDPANGLLLYCHYDRLFDKGYISFDDDLRVVVAPLATRFSPPLRDVLEQLAGRQARHPAKWAIKAEYLAYHREEMLRTVPSAQEAPSVGPAGLP